MPTGGHLYFSCTQGSAHLLQSQRCATQEALLLRTSDSSDKSQRLQVTQLQVLLIYRSCSQINSSPRTAIEGMGRRAWRLHTPRRDFIQQSSFWLQVFSIPQLAGFLHIGWLFTALHDLQTEETLVALPDDQGCCHHRRHR